MSNMRIWDALCKTDPKHTKKFQRSGGFKGTAIKPIWTTQRMTEFFGPCGIGWGPDMPQFSVEKSADEGLVFCTVGLWYIDPSTSNKGQVYGVGGDKFILQQASGIRTSDEAFKAAYTDALGNAMKLIGVAADVHMGLFDDSKYVKEMEAEFSEEDATQEVPKTIEQVVLPKYITAQEATAFRDACVSTGYSPDAVRRALADAGIKSSARIPQHEYKRWMEWANGEAEVPA